MIIKLQQELMITSDKTIDGRGARVYIMEGAGLTLQFVNNVIIHNIYVKHIVPGNGGLIRDSEAHIGLRTKSDGDGISLFGATNIWIDHVSMTRCADGMIDAIDGSTAVTISNSHFTDHQEVKRFLCFRSCEVAYETIKTSNLESCFKFCERTGDVVWGEGRTRDRQENADNGCV